MALKFYFKLENKLLPTYFNIFAPKKSQGSTKYSIRNPQNQMPQVKHQYARNTFRCELISITNSVSNTIDYEGILDKIQTHSLHGYSLYIKTKFIDLYSYECNTINCYSCSRFNDLYPHEN